MLLVGDPVALVLDPIWPRVDSVAIDLIIRKLTPVDATVRAIKQSISMLLAFVKLSYVGGIVWKGFLALAVWILVEPLAPVESAIWVATDPSTVHQVCDPLTLIHCSIRMHISSMALALTRIPVAEVVRLVHLQTETKAVLLLLSHLPHVCRSALSLDEGVAPLRIVEKELDFIGQPVHIYTYGRLLLQLLDVSIRFGGLPLSFLLALVLLHAYLEAELVELLFAFRVFFCNGLDSRQFRVKAVALPFVGGDVRSTGSL